MNLGWTILISQEVYMAFAKTVLSVLTVGILASQTVHALEVGQLVLDAEKINFKNDIGTVVSRDIYVGIGDDSQMTQKQKMGQSKSGTIELYRSKKGQLQVDAGFANIVWKDVPKWLTADIEVAGSNMSVNIGRLKMQSVTAESIDITKPRLGMIRLRGLDVKCYSANGDRMSFEGLLPQCLEKAQISSRETDIPELTKYAQLALSESEEADGQRNLGKGLQVSLNKGLLDLTLNISLKLNLSIKLKVEGKVAFNEKTNVVRVDLAKAMLNRLDVTRLALPIIKLILPNDEVQIKEDSLFLKL